MTATRRAEIRRFTPHRNPSGSMVGFLSVETASGLIIHNLKLMRGPEGLLWIGMPDAKRRDRDDRLVLGDDGKVIWDPIIEFRNHKVRDRFNEVVLEALRRAHPECFHGEPER
jgi:DNA-binding cell septation regulator SpoVG